MSELESSAAELSELRLASSIIDELVEDPMSTFFQTAGDDPESHVNDKDVLLAPSRPSLRTLRRATTTRMYYYSATAVRLRPC